MYGLGGTELRAGNLDHLLAELDAEVLEIGVGCPHPLHLLHRLRPSMVRLHAIIKLKSEITIVTHFIFLPQSSIRFHRHIKGSFISPYNNKNKEWRLPNMLNRDLFDICGTRTLVRRPLVMYMRISGLKIKAKK